MEQIEGIKVIAFADDALIMTSGHDSDTMRRRIQRAVNIFVRWGERSGLEFSHEKTESVIFKPKKKRLPWVKPLPIRIGNNPVEYSESLKFLGVTFKHDGKFDDHVNNKIKKARAHLFQLRNVTGKTWGVNPKLSKWLYTGIIRPLFTYAAHVWGRGINRTTCSKLEKLN